MQGLLLGKRSHVLSKSIENQLEEAGIKVDWTSASLSEFDPKQKHVNGPQFCIVTDDESNTIGKSVAKRSVGSHFLNYLDFIEFNNGEAWGHSLFSNVFRDTLLNSIKNQDFKGAVIFLGHSSLALPIIEVLASFGFEEFVFLDEESASVDYTQYNGANMGLIKTKVSTVDSTAFIQSQKEYSFCFVMKDYYSQQTLDDMSYFHFLSSQSMVFDLSGQSNFLFQEVDALGVGVTRFEPILEAWSQQIAEKIKIVAEKSG